MTLLGVLYILYLIAIDIASIVVSGILIYSIFTESLLYIFLAIIWIPLCIILIIGTFYMYKEFKDI